MGLLSVEDPAEYGDPSPCCSIFCSLLSGSLFNTIGGKYLSVGFAGLIQQNDKIMQQCSVGLRLDKEGREGDRVV